MAIEEVVDQTGAEDVFDTPELEVPKTPPDAHRATITSVTGRHLSNDKQTAIISINLTSIDVPTLETSMDIFVPKGFEENIALRKQVRPRDVAGGRGEQAADLLPHGHREFG